VNAATYYVDNIRGNDHYDGLAEKVSGATGPFKSLLKGVKSLKAGDSLKLVPTKQAYHESLILKNLKGTSEKPVIIDGGMSVLCGSKALNPAEWTFKNGVFAKNLYLRNNALKRYFLLVDKTINRMGRRPKFNGNRSLKTTAELTPGQWTYDKAGGKLYLKLSKGHSLNNIQEPVLKLTSGVRLLGGCEHVLIKNIIVEHFWNDGFNIHGTNKHIVFNNIIARYNGDDGISAHEHSEITVSNYISLGNCTGICHVNQSVSVNENIYIKDSAGIDLYMLNSSNTFKNTVIESHAPGGVDIRSKSVFDNCYFKNLAKEKVQARFMAKKCAVNNVSVINYNIISKSSELKKKLVSSPDNVAMVNNTLDLLKQIFTENFPDKSAMPAN
jgi:hypothetical protein